MKRILVVDDELGLADVLAATLSDVGYAVDTAANGVQALELLAKTRPDLVILDCMMPLLDGPGVLQAMHADPSAAGIPVIMMSAMPESTVRSRCPHYEAFLRKPFDFETVVGAVRTCLHEE
jgi:DNA-binding response OmpR family regulator